MKPPKIYKRTDMTPEELKSIIRKNYGSGLKNTERAAAKLYISMSHMYRLMAGQATLTARIAGQVRDLHQQKKEGKNDKRS